MSAIAQGLSREETGRALSLVRYLEEQPESLNFSVPVDYKLLQLHDYPHIIKQPMDLSTVKKKIKTAQYMNFDDMLCDLILIWDNCRTYNMIESPIVQQADAMERCMLRYCNQHGISLESAMHRPRIEEHPEVVSFQAKTALAERFKTVPPDKLAEIVQIIERECPYAILKITDERSQLRIDAIDKKVFQRINRMLDSEDRENSSPIKKVKYEA
ncbi:unnamed protein product [Blepharisma stoltei]|uniref:Bromo domain-containing protein n=1 Tax=Blepharisma stoltei TaxID=1481888 RepID=A0AAU9IWX0_9CILI|nr:unnamed protein product [Blepharisma stoltei]